MEEAGFSEKTVTAHETIVSQPIRRESEDFQVFSRNLDLHKRSDIDILTYERNNALNRRILLKSIIFWDVTSCSPMKVKRNFRGTYRFHLHGRRIIRARNQCVALLATCLHADFLLGLSFDTEDGGDMFLRNVG
jgi:hypothetical protein